MKANISHLKILIPKVSFSLFVLALYLTFMGCMHITVRHPEDSKLGLIDDNTFPTSAGKKLSISSTNGDIKVNSWTNNEIKVKVYGNEKAKAKVKFQYENNENGLKIETSRPSMNIFSSWSNIAIRYEVTVPEKYKLNLQTSGGDVVVTKVEGVVKVETSGGDIKLNQIKGNSEISTSGGDISIEDLSGNISASTSGGDVRMKKFIGDVDVSTSGGDIQLYGAEGKVDASTSGGDISLDYAGSNKGIHLGTSGGDIHIKVDKDFSAEVDLTTLGGDISTNLPVTVVHKKSSELKGKLNSGGNILECSTIGGDISVRSR
jgi:DUF4097 and DUF4098 domain-containing protein YvlB